MIKDLWRKTIGSDNPVFILIGLNVLVFILIGLFRLLISFDSVPPAWMSFLSGLTELPADWRHFVSRPWTLFTYMFVHHQFFHLLFNMLWLFWMGRIFLDFFPKNFFYKTYLGGGLFGGVVFLILFQMISAFPNSHLIGASAGVSAVVLALAVMLPNYNLQLFLFGNVPLKYLALAFIVLDLLSLSGSNMGGSLAHLGGGIFGIIIAMIKKGDLRIPAFMQKKTRSKKLKIVHLKDKIKNSVQHTEPSQELIDQILDKISKSGYENLSTKEKELLFKASKKK